MELLCRGVSRSGTHAGRQLTWLGLCWLTTNREAMVSVEGALPRIWTLISCAHHAEAHLCHGVRSVILSVLSWWTKDPDPVSLRPGLGSERSLMSLSSDRSSTARLSLLSARPPDWSEPLQWPALPPAALMWTSEESCGQPCIRATHAQLLLATSTRVSLWRWCSDRGRVELCCRWHNDEAW